MCSNKNGAQQFAGYMSHHLIYGSFWKESIMEKLIDGIVRRKEALSSIMKLTVAALAAFSAGYVLRCGVELAKSAPLEPTGEATSQRITTADSLWTCPVHPDCPLSKLNSCPRCRAGWAPLYCCPDSVGAEQPLTARAKTAPAEMTQGCNFGSVCCSRAEPNGPCAKPSLWTQSHLKPSTAGSAPAEAVPLR